MIKIYFLTKFYSNSQIPIVIKSMQIRMKIWINLRMKFWLEFQQKIIETQCSISENTLQNSEKGQKNLNQILVKILFTTLAKNTKQNFETNLAKIDTRIVLEILKLSWKIKSKSKNYRTSPLGIYIGPISSNSFSWSLLIQSLEYYELLFLSL